MKKDVVTGFREVVQDLLVPELRALKTEFVAFKEEVNKRFEEVFTELKSMRQDMEEIKISQAKIIASLDLERRITKVETIIEKILSKENTEKLVVKEEKSEYGK
jgi:uncharacterized membrane-anchored protein YhcB (DUF1043 family)